MHDNNQGFPTGTDQDTILDQFPDPLLAYVAISAKYAHVPGLQRPGPQPHNQIAGTFEEQLARAKAPRHTPTMTAGLRDAIREILDHHLADAETVEAIATAVAKKLSALRRPKRLAEVDG